MNNYISDTFEEFFKKATNFSPYPYQQDLSRLEEIPNILNIPTGAGKTEASILAIYLWRILNSDEKIRQSTPRRLVYCLPMRVLVEQTVTRIEKWLDNLGLKDTIKVVTMMGGNVDKQYLMHPEENIILIGTQDMLLSRALNRGYVASPYQWPRDFGLLNNDCLWIMDEIQLMRNGLVTSVQLEAFRNKMGTYGPHKTVWMSATVNPQWLNTIDFDSKKCSQFTLGDKDSKNKDLEKRNNAKKQLVKMDITIPKNDYTKNEIASIKEKHIDGTITLVIVNTVKRAQSIFKELKKSMNDDCMLVHSRFRKKERQNLNKQLGELISSDEKNMIIVSTQVVEAGIDISAKTLITEMAPWSSLVQRFGRCNRKGDYDDSKIHIIGLDDSNFNPYEEKDMIESEEEIEQKYGQSMSPNSLGLQKKEMIHESVIRESDIIGLFDTTPDMTGNHTDVSMYVRSLDISLDVAVIWKNWDKKIKQPPKHRISDEEICLVPIYDMDKFRKANKILLWTYDIQSDTYEEAPPQIYPGQTLLVRCDDGGYDDEIGWDPTSKKSVKEQIKDESYNEEGNSNDPESNNMKWITLNDHTVHVIKEAENIIKPLYYLDKLKDTLLDVVKYHDVGKAHYIFQNTMVKNHGQNNVSRDEFWAKRDGFARHEIDNYRHEAFSALAVLNIENIPNLELVAYLTASHHGKVRLSMRTMPTQRNRKIHDTRYLLGIDMECGAKVPIFLSDKWPKSKMSKEKIMKDTGLPKEVDIVADIARVGNTKDKKQSWLQMTLKLLKEYGPFKLALLEAVIRAADTKASAKESHSNE